MFSKTTQSAFDGDPVVTWYDIPETTPVREGLAEVLDDSTYDGDIVCLTVQQVRNLLETL
jgi:hypothetical protein